MYTHTHILTRGMKWYCMASPWLCDGSERTTTENTTTTTTSKYTTTNYTTTTNNNNDTNHDIRNTNNGMASPGLRLGNVSWL